MAYNVNLPAGKYNATAVQADCFPTKNGEGLNLGVEWVIHGGEWDGSNITSTTCLIDSSGNVTRNLERTREWAKSWDGTDTAYFKDHYTEWKVILVVERVVRPSDGKEVPEVKWINDPETHRAIIQGDHKALGAKFGAKLKAFAATYNRQHPVTAANAAATAPNAATAAKPAATAAPAAPQASAPANDDAMHRAWGLFRDKYSNLSQEEKTNLWFSELERLVGTRDTKAITADQWEKVVSEFDDSIPF